MLPSDDIWRKRTQTALKGTNSTDVDALLTYWTSVRTNEASEMAWKLYDRSSSKTSNIIRVINHWRHCCNTSKEHPIESPWNVWTRVQQQGGPPKAMSILLHALPATARFYEDQVIHSLFQTIIEYLRKTSHDNIVVWNSALRAHVTLWPDTAYEFYESLPFTDGRSRAICMESVRNVELATRIYQDIPSTDAESRDFALNHLLKIHPDYMGLLSSHDSINKHMLQTVLRRLVQDGDLDGAIALARQQMRDNPDEQHSYLLHTLIAHIAKKDPRKAESFLESTQMHHHAESINVVMDAWVAAGDLQRAKRLLHDDTYAYTILMKGYAQVQKPNVRQNECLDLFQTMKQRGIPRSPVTFATALTSIVKQRGSTEAAETIFHEYLLETQEPPTDVLLGSMIAIWSHSQTPDAIVKVITYYDQWRGLSLRDPSFPPPDTKTLKTVVRLQSMTSAKSAHRILQQINVQQRERSMYHAVLEAWKKDESPQHLVTMRQLLDEMKTIPSCEPTKGSFLIFLKALAKAGSADQARRVLQNEIADPDSYCYGATMNAHFHDPNTAQQLYEEMKKRNIQPHLFVYGVLIKIWANNIHNKDAVQRAEKVYEDLESAPDAEPGVWHMNAMMAIWASVGNVDSANRYFDLLAQKMHPQRAHFNTLLKAYQKCAAGPDIVSGATSVIQQMQQANHRPDTITYTTLLNIFCKNAIPYHEAKQVVESMMRLAKFGETSAAPNLQTWNTLLNYWSDNTATPPHTLELDWIERMSNGEESILHRIQRIRESS